MRVRFGRNQSTSLSNHRANLFVTVVCPQNPNQHTTLPTHSGATPHSTRLEPHNGANPRNTQPSTYIITKATPLLPQPTHDTHDTGEIELDRDPALLAQDPTDNQNAGEAGVFLSKAALEAARKQKEKEVCLCFYSIFA